MMAVMERPSWTDERLDGLKGTVDEGFKDMRAEFRSHRQEMASHRQEMARDREEIHTDLRAVHAEIAALNRTINQFTFALVGTVFLGFMGTITAIVTQT
jgi:hypothetical protein